jgi:hypothetical protein
MKLLIMKFGLKISLCLLWHSNLLKKSACDKWGIDKIHVPVPHRSCLSYHQFCPPLGQVYCLSPLKPELKKNTSHRQETTKEMRERPVLIFR